MKFFKFKFRKNKIKTTVLNFLLIITLLFNNVVYVSAQESTGSAQLSPTDAPAAFVQPTSPLSPSPFEEPDVTATPTPPDDGSATSPPVPFVAPATATIVADSPFAEVTPSLSATTVPTISPNFSQAPPSGHSAILRIPIQSFLVSAPHLSANQRLTVGVLNAKEVELKTTLFRQGKEVSVAVEEKLIDEAIVFLVDPPVNFTPGKYTFTITDPGGRSEQQEFWWGVVSINTDKSIYAPFEKAALFFSVLDDEGKMICDADLRVRIKNDGLGIDDELTSEKGTIKATEQCQMKNTSHIADYEASYQVGNPGVYSLAMTTTTEAGTYTTTDEFEVQVDVPFEVKRVEFPTRLNPTQETQVALKITSSRDFTGSIVEAVPAVVRIASDSATPYDWLATGTSTHKGLVTGTDSALLIRYPFEGHYPVTLKFGESILDGQEKPLYEKFGLHGHDGVDFGLPEGTPVLAVDDGEVVLAGRGAYGVTVVLQHSWGRSYYGHLQGTGMILGEKVLKGHKIALSGQTGLATGPHLHFGIKFTNPDMVNGYYGKVDPWPYLTGSSILPGYDVRLIGWNVSFKKGETKIIKYRFDAPDISPQFYLFGPLRFYGESIEYHSPSATSPFVLGLNTDANAKPVFEEGRRWQMAVDAPENPSPQPEVAGVQSNTRKAERSIIAKGKIVDTNLKENAKALKRSKGEKVDGVKDEDKLFRWEVELPHGTSFGFGRQEKADIVPTVKIRNKEGWFLEFEPLSQISANGEQISANERMSVNPKVNGNQVEWDIAPGVTARYTALKDRIKADYIVSDQSALNGNNQLSFRVTYNDTDISTLATDQADEAVKNGGGLMTAELLPDGEIHWLMENAMSAFIHPKPTVKDSVQSALEATFDIKKIGKGTSIVSIIIPEDQLASANFPITIDPVTIDSTEIASDATAYGNGRKILRDAWGNLIAVFRGSDTTNETEDVWYKNYDASSWTDANISVRVSNVGERYISADLDSSGNIHVVFIIGTPLGNLHYNKINVTRNSSNKITSMSNSISDLVLDTSGQTNRPSLTVANKGEGAGKEKVAVAWASNSTAGGTKQGEIRFLQCDNADDCLSAANWKNASEEKSGTMPSGLEVRGSADFMFARDEHTTHHTVLTQVPGRPARTPTNAKKYDGDAGPPTYTNLTNALDDNTGTAADISTVSDTFTINDQLYIGDDIKFSRIVLDITNTNSTANTWAPVNYCSANTDENTACDTWTATSNIIDNESTSTTAASEDGSILFDEPSGWVLSTEDGAKKFWVRRTVTGSLDTSISIAEIEVTDRHSKDLLIVGGVDSTDDLRAAYVIWDFIGAAGWENIPGNTTAPAPWREDAGGASSALDDTGGNWGTFTNFPLSATVNYVDNFVSVAYVEDLATDVLQREFIYNYQSLTVAGNWGGASAFPTVTEAADIVLSLTTDQKSTYLFYILDPGTNALVFRDDNEAGTWDTSESTLDRFNALVQEQSHPQAVVAKAYGDTVAIDVIYTDIIGLDVEYERHYVNMADRTIVVAASGDDAFHRDCVSDTDDQDISAITVKLGRDDADASCVSVDSENHAGFRFPSVSVSQGAAISSAYVDFRVSSVTGTGAIGFTVYAEDVNNAVTDGTVFDALADVVGSNTNLINNLTKTTTSKSESITFSGTPNQTNSFRIDVTDMVQEIVCRGAANAQPCVGSYNGTGLWASGNTIAILLISSVGEIAADRYVDIVAQDDTVTTMLDPTLQINLGNTNKRYSMGVLKAPTTSSDLDHPMETDEFTNVNTDDTLTALVSASLVPSASSSAVPIFQFKANNTNNNNTDDLSATAIVKSSIPSKSYGGPHYSGKTVYLQLYHTTNGWETKDSETLIAADTDITLSSGTVTTSTSYYRIESPGGTCSGSDCWAAWRVYQDSAAEANQILYVDNFSATFTAGGPTTDQQMRHGNWFSAGVEQYFTF